MYVDTRSHKLNITPHCLLYLNMPMQNEFRILLRFCHFEQTDALALIKQHHHVWTRKCCRKSLSKHLFGMFFEKHPKVSVETSFFLLGWTSIIKDNVCIPRIINKSVMSAGIIRVRSQSCRHCPDSRSLHTCPGEDEHRASFIITDTALTVVTLNPFGYQYWFCWQDIYGTFGSSLH